MTVRELIDGGAESLAGAGVTDSGVDAGLLYCYAAGVDRTHMILQYREPVNPSLRTAYRRLIERRAAGEPLQYITGEQEFMGLPFHVAPGVLIPRPETELLVEKAVAWAESRAAAQVEVRAAGAEAGADGMCCAGDARRDTGDAARGLAGASRDPGAGLRILDIGCGSGAIGVSMARLVPGAQVTCTDISPDALEIARENARRLSVQVEFLEGDLLEPVAGRQFDMILSNPPYIARDVIPGLAREVREHEPGEALCGGEDGLDIYRRLIPEIPQHLAPGGLAMMEIGHDQMEQVKRLLAETGAFTEITGYRDLAGLDRIVAGVWAAEVAAE